MLGYILMIITIGYKHLFVDYHDNDHGYNGHLLQVGGMLIVFFSMLCLEQVNPRPGGVPEPGITVWNSRYIKQQQ